MRNQSWFKDVTLEKLADAIPKHGIEWWRAVNEMAKAGRLVSDDNG